MVRKEDLANKTPDEFFSSFPEGYISNKTKYIIVTGSVISGVGKGTFTSSLCNLLKWNGLKVHPIKFDGYLNYDAGTLNPFRHGEVFVLDDGTECDLDLGSYERMTNQNLTKDNYLTSGKIFKNIVDKERAGLYLGRDVQFVPHVSGEIKHFIRRCALNYNPDIVIVEVGGTVGDLENSYFLEAMRELAYEEKKDNVCFVNVTYILKPGTLGEHKSKAAQLGIRTLMERGIQPNIIVCRSEGLIKDSIKEKISISSNVPIDRVINLHDVDTIYDIPLFLKEKEIDKMILDTLGLKIKENYLIDPNEWKSLVTKINDSNKNITIAITGKYTGVHDSYLSILNAVEHSAPYLNAKINLKWIETTNLNKDNVKEELKNIDGVIVPGGFGERGVEGKIEYIRYCRENKIPFLGLCYGFQMAVIEFARNVCDLKNANTTEIKQTEDPVVYILPEQEEIKDLGGTMRLGGFDMDLKKNTLAFRLYKNNKVRERFRHRYNVNPKYIETLEKNGMIFSGVAPEKKIMQILELKDHPYFLGTQYHAEFTSKPLNPSPIFIGFIEACLNKK
ncbi:MAG: CTP synthase [Candidatus Nanoarchaeia archaeon]|jgi:CTP synthase|nr:CTP synthase [Candidatus Nanoarchaeia archaeon]|tara:strand:- start:72492 stop:74174 length:1683 start_codon:yes stop_codon:yes gene_type:complete